MQKGQGSWTVTETCARPRYRRRLSAYGQTCWMRAKGLMAMLVGEVKREVAAGQVELRLRLAWVVGGR